MAIKVGDSIPACTFMWMGSDSELDVRKSTSDEIFKGKKVAVFGLPVFGKIYGVKTISPIF